MMNIFNLYADDDARSMTGVTHFGAYLRPQDGHFKSSHSTSRGVDALSHVFYECSLSVQHQHRRETGQQTFIQDNR